MPAPRAVNSALKPSLAKEVGFISTETSQACIEETRELSAMIQGLIRAIRTRNVT